MMRTILVPLAQSLAGEPALQSALAVAKRMNSHIRAMFVRPEPAIAMSYLPILPMVGTAAGVTRDAIEREGRQAAAATRVSFDAWRSRHEIPEAPADARLDSCFATWTEQVGEIEPVVTHFGRVSDLIVMSRFKANDLVAERCFDAAVFGAMPLLRAAGRVSIFCVQEAETDRASGTELAEALSWYGIPTHRVGGPETQGSTGAALLAMARGSETTLIVMGAYTHSRLRQSFLGGVTREVLADATIPVLMSH